MNTQAVGSAQPHVYPDDLKELKIIIPSDDIFKKYSKKYDYLINNINQNQKINFGIEELIKQSYEQLI